MGFVKEFKDFALKGNVVDLAVAVIIGGAFGAIISSMVDDVITPLLLAPALKDETIPKNVRDSLKHVTQDYTKRRSINFTNVKKDKGKNKKGKNDKNKKNSGAVGNSDDK